MASFLCCLDAPVIIKRNGIGFHDFSRTVKYAHFSILIFYSYYSCFTGVEPNRMSTIAKIAKQYLKCSYPGLQLFKN